MMGNLTWYILHTYFNCNREESYQELFEE